MSSQDTERTGEARPQVFISHRHDDKDIADILRDFLRSATAGVVEVFQSSYAGSGPRVGDILNEELARELEESEVVLLLYTVPDENWSYCMWETGVAFNPKQRDTRIVVLQCGEDAPAPLSDRASVRVGYRESVRSFVRQFMTDADFFVRLGGPVTRFDPNAPAVRNAGDRLYEALAKLARFAPDESWPAWPRIRFAMPLDKLSAVTSAINGGDEQAANDLLAEDCRIDESDHYAARLFGTPSFQKGLTLGELTRKWKRKRPTAPVAWIECLLRQLRRASAWEFPGSEWEYLPHADTEKFYVPILMNVCKSSRRGKIFYDVYLPRVERRDMDQSKGEGGS